MNYNCFLCKKYYIFIADNLLKCTKCGIKIRSYDDKTFSIHEEQKSIILSSWFRRNKEGELYSICEFSDNYSSNFITDPITYDMKNAADIDELIDIFISIKDNCHLM